MSILTASPVLATGVLATGVRAESLVRGTAEQLADALSTRAARIRHPHTVTNEVAPLILIAVIAVAGARARSVRLGAAGAGRYDCQAYFGRNYWPAVHWPSQNGGLFYLACKRV